jgi:hypothetical protein
LTKTPRHFCAFLLPFLASFFCAQPQLQQHSASPEIRLPPPVGGMDSNSWHGLCRLFQPLIVGMWQLCACAISTLCRLLKNVAGQRYN